MGHLPSKDFLYATDFIEVPRISRIFYNKKFWKVTIVYGAFDTIQERSSQDPLKLFHEALENVKPTVEVRSRRVGGATYQVPTEVRSDRRQTLAIRWLISAAKD